MLPGLRTPNAPQREDTADALFDQIPKGRGQQVKRDLHAVSFPTPLTRQYLPHVSYCVALLEARF